MNVDLVQVLTFVIYALSELEEVNFPLWTMVSSSKRWGQSFCLCLAVVRSCCFSVTKLCPTLGDPMNCSTPGLPVLHYLLQFAESHVHGVNDAIQPSHFLSPLLLLPSVFPSIRIFSNELALCIRWPNYWSFSFNTIPSNEQSELISIRIDWQLTDWSPDSPRYSQESSPAPQFESISSSVLSLLYGQTLISVHDYWKNHSFD